MIEYFPVIDEEGNVIDRATRQECHNGSKLLHAAVHLHVFNAAGDLYLQKRADWKDIQPGKWDTAVGGHIDFGESVDIALLREAREELGLTDIQPERLFNYIWESPREREMIYVHTIVYDKEPVLNLNVHCSRRDTIVIGKEHGRAFQNGFSYLLVYCNFC